MNETHDRTPIEEALGVALRRAAEAKHVEDRPFAARAEVRRRPRLLLAVATAVAVAAVAAGLALVGDGGGDRERARETVGAADPHPAEERPLLGPLPYVGFGPGGPIVNGVEVNQDRVDRFGPDEVLLPWWAQTYRTESVVGPYVNVLTIRGADGGSWDGPLDDVRATYATSRTTAVEVQGEPARLLEERGLREVWWPTGGPGGTLVQSRGLTLPQVLELADSMVLRPAAEGWDVAALPAGLVPWTDGVRDARPDRADMWWLQANLTVPDRDLTGDLFLQQADEMDLSQAALAVRGDAVAVEVLGRPASLSLDEANHMVQVAWVIADGVSALLWLMGDDASQEEALRVLGTLRLRTEEEWLAELPASSITAAQQEALLAEIGPGTPLPGGAHLSSFRVEPGRIEEVVVLRDQWLGSGVLEVRCAWVAGWLAAVDAGDAAGAEAAVSALEQASTWSIVEALPAQRREGSLSGLGQRIAQMRAGAVEEIRASQDTAAAC